MAENVVGETGFEPATLCSQSQQLSRDFSASLVKPGEIRANQINSLEVGCKTQPGLVSSIIEWVFSPILTFAAAKFEEDRLS